MDYMDYTIKNVIEATRDARLHQVDNLIEDILEGIARCANDGNTCYSMSRYLFATKDVTTLVARRLNALGFSDVEWDMCPDLSVRTLTVRWPEPALIDKEE